MGSSSGRLEEALMVTRDEADVFLAAATTVLADMQVARAKSDWHRFGRDLARLSRLIAAIAPPSQLALSLTRRRLSRRLVLVPVPVPDRREDAI